MRLRLMRIQRPLIIFDAPEPAHSNTPQALNYQKAGWLNDSTDKEEIIWTHLWPAMYLSPAHTTISADYSRQFSFVF